MENHAHAVPALRAPLPPWARHGLLVLIVALHATGGWALTQVEGPRAIVGEVASLQFRMLPAEQPALPVESALPTPALATRDVRPPAEPQPPDMPRPETMLDPPPPELPRPVFPVAASPPPPALPPQPKAQPRMPAVREAAPPAAASAPAAAALPRTVSASQVQFLLPPAPVYPARSRRAGEQGSVLVRVLVDIAGAASQVSLQTSSRYPALDEAALVAVRNARFRPFTEGGAAQPVWVLVPINFVLE